MADKLELYVDEENQRMASKSTATGKVVEYDLSHLTPEQFKIAVQNTKDFLDSKAKRWVH